MNTTNSNLQETILIFNSLGVGRDRKLSFEKEGKISESYAFTLLFSPEKLDEKAEYLDESGNPVGLTIGEAKTGIGRIDRDADYRYTYSTYLSDLNEDELEAIQGYTSLIEDFKKITSK